MKMGLGIPLPREYAQRVESFRAEHSSWAIRPMRSHPHISIKGPAGLNESTLCMQTIEDIAQRTTPFTVALTEPAIFEAEPILYLGVDSPGWWTLHRALVDELGQRPGVQLHPFEIAGWIPHTTVMRLKADLPERHLEILSTATEALSPYASFTAKTLRMYRQDHDQGQWKQLHDFALSG